MHIYSFLSSEPSLLLIITTKEGKPALSGQALDVLERISTRIEAIGAEDYR